MTERKDLKSGRIPGAGFPDTAACGQWETLLADALDAQLKAEDEGVFSSHMAGCPACAALFEGARRGREWLSFLSAEPEAPEGLMDRILARTGPGHSVSHVDQIGGAAALPAAANWPQPVLMNPVSMSPVPITPGFMSYARRASLTRMMMTAAMAFFSLALTLNLGGVRLQNLRLNAIRPAIVSANLERRLATATVPMERYYDHLRVVHEVESSVRLLRNNINGENEDGKQRRSQPDGSGVSGGADAAEHNKDSAVNEPPVNEPAFNDSCHVTSAPDYDFAHGAQTRSSIWTA